VLRHLRPNSGAYFVPEISKPFDVLNEGLVHSGRLDTVRTFYRRSSRLGCRVTTNSPSRCRMINGCNATLADRVRQDDIIFGKTERRPRPGAASDSARRLAAAGHCPGWLGVL
jgi:hypothetical protein